MMKRCTPRSLRKPGATKGYTFALVGNNKKTLPSEGDKTLVDVESARVFHLVRVLPRFYGHLT